MMVSLLPGCASKEPQGVREYRQITGEALTAVQASLESLDQVNASTGRCPPKVAAAYCADLQGLQVHSIRVRERSQAILARGDAYFADWPESLERIKNPQIRELAERHHDELEKSFSEIKLHSKQAGAAFKPFLSSLQQLRVKLETEPGGIESDTVKTLIRDARSNGQQVVQELGAVNSELKTVSTLLTPKR